MGLEVGRARDDDPLVGRERDADEAGVVELTDAHRQVEAVVHDVGEPIAQVERRGHLLVGRDEGGHERRDMAPAEARGRRDPHVAARLDAAERHRGLGIGDVVEDAVAVLQERFALEGEREPPGRAHQQLHAEAGLERVDAPPDHGGGDALRLGGTRQAAASHHRGEGFQLLQSVHVDPGRLRSSQTGKGTRLPLKK